MIERGSLPSHFEAYAKDYFTLNGYIMYSEYVMCLATPPSLFKNTPSPPTDWKPKRGRIERERFISAKFLTYKIQRFGSE